MIVPLPDPLLIRIPIRDTGEPLVDVETSAPLLVARRTVLRSGLVDRLVAAQSLLPRKVRLLIVAGYRPPAMPCRYLTCAVEQAEQVCTTPPETAPHPTGGAVDLTLANGDDTVLLPECCVGPIAPAPDETTQLLTSALAAIGLVNHPARWWHWSYGDRFWAGATQAPHARYGPTFAEEGPGPDVVGGVSDT
ncbi:M15 family metallopeptidase [Amycolatopsis sp. DG1A-15b]|uniref:M15 family metallopeptidase n=1 Tax=Amycolatopsis sp. DG1A-15b TaxID=3052846 RepID=UPI00255BB86D|nr:M15 family metallopeptidase [Amycolatopsis sp. DG1A-15b]WIX90392.1 M15 family metallopeptidase [Amycolatopsis sp. DG1A-15b]